MNEEKFKVWKMQIGKGSQFCVVDASAFDAIAEEALNLSPGDTLRVTAQEMTKKQFEDLGEFNGW